MNIETELIDKYILKNEIKNEGENNRNYNNTRTKIIKFCYYSMNEVEITNMLNQIPYYSNFFSLLQNYEKLNISQLNEYVIEKLKNIENIENNYNYYLFEYNDKGSVTFIDNIYNSLKIKKLIFDLINTFEHILKGLHVLNQNNICFFNIRPQNIIFLHNYREKPVLSNFQLSLQLQKLELSYFTKILCKLHDFTYMPLEIHLLFYIIKQNMITVSYSFIEQLSEKFVNNLHILKLFSENYKKSYKLQCIEFLKKYINMNTHTIIHDIFQKNNKWDVFSISMIYIHLFGSISRIFSLKGTFISKITIELSKNLHPDPDKRYTLIETLNLFNKLLNEQVDWCFVNNLDNTKLPQLFDDFSN